MDTGSEPGTPSRLDRVGDDGSTVAPKVGMRPPAHLPQWLGSSDVEVMRADALDRVAIVKAIVNAAPDAIVHMLTAIPDEDNPRRLLQQFGATTRLWTEGTQNLLEGAERPNVLRFVAQGLAYAYDRLNPAWLPSQIQCGVDRHGISYRYGKP